MKRTEDFTHIETYRDYTIALNKATSQFVVKELAELEPVATVQAARNLVDRFVKGLNKGVRRPVLTFSESYSYGDDDDKPRSIREGELTSWTHERGYRKALVGVVMFGRERETLTPEKIFDNTPENRTAMEAVIDTDKLAIAAKAQGRRLEKKIKRVELPEHLKGNAKEDPDAIL